MPKFKQVFMQGSDDESTSAAAPAFERTPKQQLARERRLEQILDQEILKTWQAVRIVWQNGSHLDGTILDVGTYWLLLQTDNGPALLNKAHIAFIVPQAQP